MKTTTIYLHGYSGDEEGLAGVTEALGYEPSVRWRLPGFCDGVELPEDAHRDIQIYAEIVWQDILKKYPDENLRLVGHSHGAMVAYALASAYPERVAELVLICPVSRPRWPTRLFTRFIGGMAKSLPQSLFMSAIKSRFVVDFVGIYMSSKHWSKADKRRIKQIRRNEAKRYSMQMIDMFDQALNFHEIMKDTRVSVPTRMCYATDDNIAGKRDLDWYFTHCVGDVSAVSIRGGHLAVLAEPHYVADKLRS